MAGNTNIGTAFLKVVGEVDKSTASKISKEFESAGTQSGNSFLSGFKGLGKKIIGIIGLAEIGKVIGQTISNSVKAYADFEQLQGGVEKIFDQADQAQILKDAQNAYKDLNMSVNDYLSSINQVGATFAQTMGDQKGYDIARKGMKAIADYSSGTGRNLEELNQKYALITRAASSYQSIADQFSGILPATSQAFLEQAQAAGFLSDKYKKLTDVPIDEYQQAVTLMLEKGVSDMGLLGNTAAETEHTLSGSIAGMKASWENFLMALGDPNGNVDEAMNGLLQSITAVTKNIVPIIGQVISELIVNLPEMIGELLPIILDALEKLVLKVAGRLSELLSDPEAIITSLGNMISSVGSTLGGMIEGLLPIIDKALGTLLMKIGEMILGWKDRLFTDFGNWVAELVNGTDNAGDQMAAATGEGVDKSIAEVERLPDGAHDALDNIDCEPGGRSLAESFARGISAGEWLVSQAAMGLAAAAHAPIPASPAKIGPFSGKGWTLYGGMETAEAFAEGFTRKIGQVQSQINSGMRGIAATINQGDAYNISMSVTADSTTTLDNLVAQARRARALNGGY